MQTIKPAKDMVFAKPSEKETMTKSGFYLKAETAEAPQTASVINSGSDRYSRDDVIVYKPYTTTDIKLEGQEYFLIHVEDILGTVVEN